METNVQFKSILSEFLSKLEKAPAEIIDTLLLVSDDEDEKKFIQALAPVFIGQIKEVSSFISEKTNTASSQNLLEVESFLRISGAIQLVDSIKTMLPGCRASIGRFGISDIFHEIKKIINWLLENLIKNPPTWLKPLLVIIDEIINDLLGGKSIKTRAALAEMERNYLSELILLEKLQKAGDYKYIDTDEDE